MVGWSCVTRSHWRCHATNLEKPTTRWLSNQPCQNIIHMHGCHVLVWHIPKYCSYFTQIMFCWKLVDMTFHSCKINKQRIGTLPNLNRVRDTWYHKNKKIYKPCQFVMDMQMCQCDTNKPIVLTYIDIFLMLCWHLVDGAFIEIVENVA